jgi:hypothetical protein
MREMTLSNMSKERQDRVETNTDRYEYKELFEVRGCTKVPFPGCDSFTLLAFPLFAYSVLGSE